MLKRVVKIENLFWMAGEGRRKQNNQIKWYSTHREFDQHYRKLKTPSNKQTRRRER